MRSISTVVEPGGISTSARSHPYVKTTRRAGTSSTYSPEQVSPLAWVQRTTPPGRGSSVASSAIHCTNSAGSVNNSYSTCGGRVDLEFLDDELHDAVRFFGRVFAGCVGDRLGGGSKSLQRCGPELVEERGDLADPLQVGPVEAAVGVDPNGHQAGVAEQLEVLAGG